jgi:hypothetical protein
MSGMLEEAATNAPSAKPWYLPVPASFSAVKPQLTGSATRGNDTGDEELGRYAGHAPRCGPGSKSSVPHVGPAQPLLQTQSPSAEQWPFSSQSRLLSLYDYASVLLFIWRFVWGVV